MDVALVCGATASGKRALATQRITRHQILLTHSNIEGCASLVNRKGYESRQRTWDLAKPKQDDVDVSGDVNVEEETEVPTGAMHTSSSDIAVRRRARRARAGRAPFAAAHRESLIRPPKDHSIAAQHQAMDARDTKGVAAARKTSIPNLWSHGPLDSRANAQSPLLQSREQGDHSSSDAAATLAAATAAALASRVAIYAASTATRSAVAARKMAKSVAQKAQRAARAARCAAAIGMEAATSAASQVAAASVSVHTALVSHLQSMAAALERARERETALESELRHTRSALQSAREEAGRAEARAEQETARRIAAEQEAAQAAVATRAAREAAVAANKTVEDLSRTVAAMEAKLDGAVRAADEADARSRGEGAAHRDAIAKAMEHAAEAQVLRSRVSELSDSLACVERQHGALRRALEEEAASRSTAVRRLRRRVRESHEAAQALRRAALANALQAQRHVQEIESTAPHDTAHVNTDCQQARNVLRAAQQRLQEADDAVARREEERQAAEREVRDREFAWWSKSAPFEVASLAINEARAVAETLQSAKDGISASPECTRITRGTLQASVRAQESAAPPPPLTQTTLASQNNGAETKEYADMAETLTRSGTYANKKMCSEHKLTSGHVAQKQSVHVPIKDSLQIEFCVSSSNTKVVRAPLQQKFNNTMSS